MVGAEQMGQGVQQQLGAAATGVVGKLSLAAIPPSSTDCSSQHAQEPRVGTGRAAYHTRQHLCAWRSVTGCMRQVPGLHTWAGQGQGPHRTICRAGVGPYFAHPCLGSFVLR